MNEQNLADFPHGVLVSLDAGTPSALEGGPWGDILEYPRVLEQIAGCAAGPLGAASLRARRPRAELQWIQAELLRVEELARLVRAGKGVIAEDVPELAKILSRLRIPGSVLDGPELLAIRRTLSAARLVSAELARVQADAPHVAELAIPAPDKSLERRLEQAIDDDGTVRDTASPALAAARSEIRVARERLVQRLEAILRATGGEGGVTLRDGRYVIPVARDLRTRPDGIVHGESASGATLFLEPSAVIGLANALREAEAAALREELKVLRTLSEMLRPEVEHLRALHAMCVEVDDVSARAKWAVLVDGYAPQVSMAPAELRIVNGRHPLLIPLDQHPTRNVVPFDLTLEGPERTVLLSGPNTGGKSVLLKAVGLHLALAQSGIVPPVGPGSALPIVARIFADIGDRQSIAESLSTFSAHLALLRVILESAGDTSLVLLDEIGSGTDPAEGGALAAATLETLTRRGAITLATTHLGALKELATRTPGIVNASLQFDAATLQPTYRLVKGIPGRSYGIAIARRLGLPADVLAEAEAQVPDRERSLDALLAAVELREREQMRREAELAARQAEQEARGDMLAAQAETQAIREAALRKREKEAERTAREQTRQYLLEAREKVEAAIHRVEAAADAEAAREARRMVEQAAGAEARALKALQEAETGDGAASAGLEAGQRVRLESGTVGEVFGTRSDGKVVVRVGSLKLVVEPAGLTPVAGPAKKAAPAPSRPEPLDAAAYEVDLRGLTGDEAEQSVLAALDAAVLAEQPYLRIIHGKGTGVVRDRVQQVVRRDRRVKSHAFAPSNQGGTGVTMVEFAE
ncbi:MAG TPA: Smr/MutS family protein [Gemmatimonadales bacterium]|nr:Smr/MutS family protein [Gemmatimonadales bacterium]